MLKNSDDDIGVEIDYTSKFRGKYKIFVQYKPKLNHSKAIFGKCSKRPKKSINT